MRYFQAHYAPVSGHAATQALGNRPAERVARAGDSLTTVQHHHCSASIDVVLFGYHLASQADLMKWADAAMHQAKDADRNAHRFIVEICH